MAAIAGVYRRKLPSPPAIEFASSHGKQVFAESLSQGNMEGFFKLISYYQTQSEPAFCGPATLSMVLNALAIDPGRKWKGPWRWFDDTMLDCCEPMDKVKVSGISFDAVACVALCNGAKVDAFHTNESKLEDFRKYILLCTSSEDHHLIVSYHRGHLQQTGAGHFSPIGGYHAAQDLVLILDVARFKYPPHWVPLTLLWEAMDTVDEDTGCHRGFMMLTRSERVPSVLYTLSCRDKSWEATAKYLTEGVGVVISSEEIKDVPELLEALMASAPADVCDFISWVAEVRLQEDGSELTDEEKARLSLKEQVLSQARETALFQHVTNFCAIEGSSNNTELINGRRNDVLFHCCQRKAIGKYPSINDVITILLLALPPDTWLKIRNKGVKEEMIRVTSSASLPAMLQDEVLHLRRQLHFLSTG